MSYWYLATPYTNYPGGPDAAVDAAATQAALLLSQDIPIFCPITHSHSIAKHIDLSHEFWMNLDRKFMLHAKGLIVCQLEGWKNSKGIEMEMEYFFFLKRPIVFMAPGELPTLGETAAW